MPREADQRAEFPPVEARARDARDQSGQALKEFQRENARLKRMLTDEMLGKELLKEVLEKKL